MPTLHGIAVDIAVSDTVLPAYIDPEPGQEPDTTSSYIEAISNRWFHVFVRVPSNHQPKGDVFVIKVWLDCRVVAELWHRPDDQLPATPHPEGEHGFEGDFGPMYEPDRAKALRESEEKQHAADAAGQWLMQGYISGEALRFPHVVTDHNTHEAGDAAEWEGKEIVVQLREGRVLEEASEDAFGNHVPGKVETVGEVLTFTFKYRPQKILEAILAQSGDPDSPDSVKTIRPNKGKGRANSLDSNATVRPNPSTDAVPNGDNARKPVWNSDMQCVEWLTEAEFVQRMSARRQAHPADQQWRENLKYFNSPDVYCCRRIIPTQKFTWCDNANCEIQVFHFWCVGLTREPHWGLSRWFCPICRHLPDEDIRIRTREEEEKISQQMG